MNQPTIRKQGFSTGSIDVALFASMERDSCIRLWTSRLGFEPPKYTSVPFMRYALAHETQLDAFGGHSSAVKRALKEAWRAYEAAGNIDDSADKRSSRQAVVSATVSSTLKPGTHLVREWNGRAYQVEVTEAGFRLDGRDYRSLSSIARKITGTPWSGPRFFGLKTR